MPVGPLLEPEQKEKSFIPPLLIKALEKPRGGGTVLENLIKKQRWQISHLKRNDGKPEIYALLGRTHSSMLMN